MVATICCCSTLSNAFNVAIVTEGSTALMALIKSASTVKSPAVSA